MSASSLTAQRTRAVYRKGVNRVMLGLCTLAAVVALSALLLVLTYLLAQGLRSVNLRMVTQGPMPMGVPGGGIRNGIVGTLVLLGVASVIGIPLGILGGVHQIESQGRFAWTVRFLTDVLNSIPSIVIGIFVYIVVVLPTARRHPGQGFSAFAGGVALGVLMIPTVMRTTEEMLRLAPAALRDASLALGGTRWRTSWSIVLPAARAGIITGVMLALARVAGETAPLLFTALGNTEFNIHLNRPINAIPLDIFYDATSAYEYLHRQALAGAIILVALIFLLSLVTRFVTRNRFGEG
jgi:phosphate transport system permease protein